MAARFISLVSLSFAICSQGLKLPTRSELRKRDLNDFAENILFWPDPEDPSKGVKHRKEDWRTACIGVREGGTEIEHFTWKQLREQVGVLSNAMRARGVKKGDRIGLVASSSFDTLSVFLATTALGGIFSSSSTDMGTRGNLPFMHGDIIPC